MENKENPPSGASDRGHQCGTTSGSPVSSRRGPRGVRDSGAVTGAPGLSPTGPVGRFGRLLQGVFTPRSSPPSHQNRGLSGQEPTALLVLFFAVCQMYHSFFPLSRGTSASSCYKAPCQFQCIRLLKRAAETLCRPKISEEKMA